MKRFLLALAVFLAALGASGQTPKIDSLKKVVNTSVDNREKMRAMAMLFELFQSLPKDTLWKYALKGKALSRKISDPHGLSLAIIAQADAYLEWDNADSAKALIEPELKKYHADDAAGRDIYFRLQHLQLYFIPGQSDYKDRIAHVYRTIQEAERYKDSLTIAESFNSLSIYKYEMNFNKEAISLALKGLSLTSNSSRYDNIVINLSGNLAEYYSYTGKEDSATYFADKTYNLSKQAGYLNFQAWALQKKSAIYLKKKQYQKAEEAIRKSMAYEAEINGDEPADDNLLALADVYNDTKQYEKAIKTINEGIAFYNTPKNLSPHAKHDTSNYGVQRIYLYKMLAKSYHLAGDSKNYEALLEKVTGMMDAVYQANSAQAIAEYETKYKVQKNEATIAQQKLALVRENYLFYGSLLVAALGAVIALLIIREIRRNERLRAEKAVREAEETERKRIAADLHDNLGSQLSFIKRNVGFIIDRPAGFSLEDERKYLGSVNDIAQNAMIDLRETIWVLNKDEVTVQEFADKLKSYLSQQLTGRENIQWEFKEELSQGWKLSSGMVMHLFRITQEVISNTVKHADADHIITLFESHVPGKYRLVIVDNGKGFDINKEYDGHYGLDNMEARAKAIGASLSINSGAKGTRIILTNE